MPDANHAFASSLRIGHGYDLHRLDALPPAGKGRPFVLGGVSIPSLDFGPVGHSDADVLLHAVTDAILGALGEPDIGQLFPDDDPRHEAEDSSAYVLEAAARMRRAGFELVNADCTVICEKPKLKPIKDRIKERIAELVGVEPSRINIKGKTHEQVDAVGEGRAIESHVVLLLAKSGSER